MGFSCGQRGSVPASANCSGGAGAGTTSAFARGVRLIPFLICLLAAAGCDESVVGPTVPLDQSFTLGVGEAANVAGQLVIEFTGVTGDSRCPADAVCIQGGDAVVHVRVSGGDTAAYELHTGDASRASVTHRSLRISLVQLQPFPFSSRTIAPDEYRATLSVSRP